MYWLTSSCIFPAVCFWHVLLNQLVINKFNTVFFRTAMFFFNCLMNQWIGIPAATRGTARPRARTTARRRPRTSSPTAKQPSIVARARTIRRSLCTAAPFGSIGPPICSDSFVSSDFTAHFSSVRVWIAVYSNFLRFDIHPHNY